MKLRIWALRIVSAIGFSIPYTAVAHHAFAAVFDEHAIVEITGTVTKLEWMNPHTWFYMDVKGPDGMIRNWAFEMGSPNGLVRTGWTRSTLSVGEQIRVTGYQAKDGSTMASVKSVTLADGRELSGLSSNKSSR